MLRYVMTKLETQTLLDKQVTSIDCIEDSGSETDDETGAEEENTEMDSDLSTPALHPRPASTPVYAMGALDLDGGVFAHAPSRASDRKENLPNYENLFNEADTTDGNHSSEEELEEINKTEGQEMNYESESEELELVNGVGPSPGGSSSGDEAPVTPVQFSMSPPTGTHVYKPRRSLSPPAKVFPMEDDSDHTRPFDAKVERAEERRERRAISPRKRYRLSRVHHLQRPCLDFEKMQQIKTRAVTSWRHGGELSLFCW